MTENGLIIGIMVAVVAAMLARRHYLDKRRDDLIRDFLADPERKARQGEI